jgi:hypothetical protein
MYIESAPYDLIKCLHGVSRLHAAVLFADHDFGYIHTYIHI